MDTSSQTNLKAVQELLRATQFAAERHAKQRRKGAAAEPYLNHLIEVAQLVSTGLRESDVNLVIAALLHDTIEDVGVTRKELAQRFGSDVANLVAEVTDDKSLPKQERKRLQIENAPKKSIRAQTIKLADKISNLRAILFSPPTNWDFERKKEYFAWAKRVVDGFTEPNPVLKAEFDLTLQRFDDLVRPAASLTEVPADRSKAIVKARLAGKTLAEIGVVYEISRQRVDKIVKAAFAKDKALATTWSLMQKKRRMEKAGVLRVQADASRKLEATYGPTAHLLKLGRCLGCGEKGGVRWIRSHKCPSGWAWYRRLGKNATYVTSKKSKDGKAT